MSSSCFFHHVSIIRKDFGPKWITWCFKYSLVSVSDWLESLAHFLWARLESSRRLVCNVSISHDQRVQEDWRRIRAAKHQNLLWNLDYCCTVWATWGRRHQCSVSDRQCRGNPANKLFLRSCWWFCISWIMVMQHKEEAERRGQRLKVKGNCSLTVLADVVFLCFSTC